MSFYDAPRGWLEAELGRERTALADKLHSRLAELLRAEGATRRSVREGSWQRRFDTAGYGQHHLCEPV
jgi:hypothetical protein